MKKRMRNKYKDNSKAKMKKMMGKGRRELAVNPCRAQTTMKMIKMFKLYGQIKNTSQKQQTYLNKEGK